MSDLNLHRRLSHFMCAYSAFVLVGRHRRNIYNRINRLVDGSLCQGRDVWPFGVHTFGS